MQGFLSKGILEVKLPHSRFDISKILIIEEAIRCAWKMLKQSLFDLSKSKEDAITVKLLRKLEYLRAEKIINGFDDKHFETVIRGGNLEDYSGKHINKQPDLVFRLCGIRPGVYYSEQDGIITECKSVDKKHSLKNEYCDKGLKRFVEGEYAWAMPHAMMIGYVKGNYTIETKLYNALKKYKEYNTEKLPYLCNQTQKKDVSVTLHQRKFTYPRTGNKAGDIEIRHLWLVITD